MFPVYPDRSKKSSPSGNDRAPQRGFLSVEHVLFLYKKPLLGRGFLSTDFLEDGYFAPRNEARQAAFPSSHEAA